MATALEAYQYLTKDVERLELSISSILRFAHPPSARKCFIDLTHIIGKAVEAISRSFPMVEFLYDPTQLSYVDGDAELLVQVFEELLYNSSKAMDGQGRVKVDIQRRHDDSVTVVVEDNGPGIKPEMEGQIFHPFVSATPNGTGLGLVFVRHVLSDHQGAIHYLAAVPHGARFVLNLPPTSKGDILETLHS
jgi:signal transduction histidine kinase